MSTDSSESSSLKGKTNKEAPGGFGTIGTTMSLPLLTLSSLLAMQDVEDHKPRLSKISWLPDIFVFRSSILPIILGPVVTVTLFSAGVAATSLWWGKEVGLTNNVVPLLSVVVGLLMVFRNSSAYERYAEGRKDFTTLISIARNLSRNIWVVVTLPPPSTEPGAKPPITREQLTVEKRKLIRLVVAFVVATKHHLRAEGGVHHDDLKGLLPARLAGSDLKRLRSTVSHPFPSSTFSTSLVGSPNSISPTTIPRGEDEEAILGLNRPFPSPGVPIPPAPASPTARSDGATSISGSASARVRQLSGPAGVKRRPTAVRIVLPDEYTEANPSFTVGRGLSVLQGRNGSGGMRRVDERTPLIKAGVKPDPLTSLGLVQQRAEVGLGRMVELGLPLIIAHDISRTIFRFRRMGCLEAVGPAGMSALQASVSAMTDQLGSMERIVQTPLPYVFCVHLKQVVSLYLFVLPFTLVDTMGWKMVFIMFGISVTFMGVEGIAAMIEQPFGTDAADLNLDLYCTELMCECEALLERLPEGDDDDAPVYERSVAEQAAVDYDDGGD